MSGREDHEWLGREGLVLASAQGSGGPSGPSESPEEIGEEGFELTFDPETDERGFDESVPARRPDGSETSPAIPVTRELIEETIDRTSSPVVPVEKPAGQAGLKTKVMRIRGVGKIGRDEGTQGGEMTSGTAPSPAAGPAVAGSATSVAAPPANVVPSGSGGDGGSGRRLPPPPSPNGRRWQEAFGGFVSGLVVAALFVTCGARELRVVASPDGAVIAKSDTFPFVLRSVVVEFPKPNGTTEVALKVRGVEEVQCNVTMKYRVTCAAQTGGPILSALRVGEEWSVAIDTDPDMTKVCQAERFVPSCETDELDCDTDELQTRTEALGQRFNYALAVWRKCHAGQTAANQTVAVSLAVKRDRVDQCNEGDAGFQAQCCSRASVRAADSANTDHDSGEWHSTRVRVYGECVQNPSAYTLEKEDK